MKKFLFVLLVAIASIACSTDVDTSTKVDIDNYEQFLPRTMHCNHKVLDGKNYLIVTGIDRYGHSYVCIVPENGY